MGSGDVLFANGLVRTLDSAGTTAESVLVRNGRILAVGPRPICDSPLVLAHGKSTSPAQHCCRDS